MTQPDPNRPAPRPGGSAGPVLMLLVFAFGIAAGLMIAVGGAGFLERSGGLILTGFFDGLSAAAAVGGLLLLFRRAILRRILGIADAQIENLADPLAQVARAAAERDAGLALGGARDLVVRGLALYGWLATRRWVVASLTALIAAMAALAGTALLYRQNQLLAAQSGLLAQQNDKIREQTGLLRQEVELAEAARNAALAVEITDIAALIGAAAEAVQARAAADSLAAGQAVDPVAAQVNVLDPMTDIDRGLALRIVSASRAARPYRFLDTGLLPDDSDDKMRMALAGRRADLPKTWERISTARGWTVPGGEAALIDRPASPERGQLLQVLMAGGLRNLEIFNHFGLDLSFAQVPNADIILLTGQGGRFAYADFSGSALRATDLGGAMLQNARFRRVSIRDCDFSVVGADRARPPFRAEDAPFSSFLQGADFADSVIRDTRFTGAYLVAASFDRALMVNADLAGADLGAATFRGAVLIGVQVRDASLKSVDLDGAVVFGADALDRLLHEAAAGSFRADRYRLEPLTADQVMAMPRVFETLEADELAGLTAGAAPFRVTRIAALED